MQLSFNQLCKLQNTMLLTGQTGTGKSHLARLVHQNSNRKSRPFVAVNLASISDALLESELFGHVKGAFTSAVSDRVGFCDAAGEGTLFLDEIGELSLESQKKLLQLLEEKSFVPVGQCRPRAFRGVIIAATNKNLEKMVREGKFRDDLYHRLNLFTYEVSSLRGDKDKIKSLIREFCIQFGRPETDVSEECMAFLCDYSWAGNVRELKHCMEFLCTLSEGKMQLRDLPEWIQKNAPSLQEAFLQFDENVLPSYPEEYERALELFERNYFAVTLKKFQGRINYTADRIKISKATLIAKARKYGIDTMELRMLARA